MDWQRVAAIGMALSAGLVIAFAVFLAWACCKVASDLDAIEDHERRLRGE